MPIFPQFVTICYLLGVGQSLPWEALKRGLLGVGQSLPFFARSLSGSGGALGGALEWRRGTHSQQG